MLTIRQVELLRLWWFLLGTHIATLYLVRGFLVGLHRTRFGKITLGFVLWLYKNLSAQVIGIARRLPFSSSSRSYRRGYH